MADLQGLIHNVPPVTRFFLISIVLVTGPVLLQQLSPGSIYLSWSHIRQEWEIWRVWSSFFFVGGGFPALYDFFLIYRNGSSLEKETFMNRTGEYAWANLMVAFIILVFNIPFNIPFLFRPLLHAQNYLWCRANPTMSISLFGLLNIPVPYYPIAMIVLDLILGGPPKGIAGLVGMLAGHTWWFLSTYLPTHPSAKIKRRNPLQAPRRFLNLFPSGQTDRIYGRGFEAARRRGSTAGGRTSANSEGRTTSHNWGRSGQRLGGEPL